MEKRSLNQDLYNDFLFKEDFFKEDLWDFKTSYYDKLTEKQRKSLGPRSTFIIDFSIIKNETNKKSFKYFLYQSIINEDFKISSIFEYRYNFKFLFDFFNKHYSRKNKILLQNDEEKSIALLTDFLISQNKKTYKIKGYYLKENGEKSPKKIYCNEIVLLKKFYTFFKEERNKGNDFKLNDIWKVKELNLPKEQLGVRTNIKTLNFSQINQKIIKNQLKEYVLIAKDFIRIGTILSRINSFNKFSTFLQKEYPQFNDLNSLDRKIIEGFFAYIETLNSQLSYKKEIKKQLENSLQDMLNYHIININEPLFYKEDFQYKIRKKPPKTISNSVLEQLNKILTEKDIHLPFSRMIFVLQHTGLRISDLCLLPFDSVVKDSEGDYHLKAFQNKTSKWVTIPIDEGVALMILNQERETKLHYPKSNFVFVNTKGEPYTQNKFSHTINRLSEKYKITDEHGNIYRFKAHDFRRTKATSMLESGLQSHIIAKFLGHANTESLKHYTKVNNKKVEAAIKIINEYHEQIMDINFDYKDMIEEEKKAIESKGLLPLPNGFCGSKEECRTAFACYSCPFFKPHKHFLTQYSRQLQLAKESLQIAKLNDLSRQIDLNEQLIKNIEKVINKVSK